MALKDTIQTLMTQVQDLKAANAEELEALARERLGLVLPGDRIFRFTSGAQEEP